MHIHAWTSVPKIQSSATSSLPTPHSVITHPVLWSSRWTFLEAFKTLRIATISFVMLVTTSVCPHGTTRLPLDRFAWNLTLEHFSKICQEKWNLIKIWKSNVYSCTLREDQYRFGIKSHILGSITFYFKLCPLWDKVKRKNKFSLRLYCWRCRIHLQQQQYTLFIFFLQLTWNGQA